MGRTLRASQPNHWLICTTQTMGATRDTLCLVRRPAAAAEEAGNRRYHARRSDSRSCAASVSVDRAVHTRRLTPAAC